MEKCECGNIILFSGNDKICKFCRAKKTWEESPNKLWLEKWGIPKKTADEFLEIPAKQFKQTKRRFDKSLYLTGKAGIGKTSIAIAQMLYNAEQYYCGKVNTNISATLNFITTPELLFKLRQTYNKPINPKTHETAEERAVNYYRDIDVLVLDDFGVEKITDWASTMLYLILTDRYENDRVTIFTSNLSLDELTAQLKDARLTSRIGGWCDIIEFKGKDRRKK